MRKPEFTNRSPRLLATFSAGAVAIITSTVLATTGSAQTEPTTLHLHAIEQTTVGFTFNGVPRQGDRFGWGDRLTGTDTGYDRGACTFVGKATALCTIQIQLSKGTLAAQALLGPRSNNTPVTITGGTGAYNGARGTALLTDIPPNKANVTITLLP